MAKVIWSAKARKDVEGIVRYIADDKPSTAELYARRIFTATRQLKDFPKSGRIVPEESNENVRELIFGSYRIIYEIIGDKITILTVHHSARILHID